MTGLFAPPPALPPHLHPFRFWIWLQFVALRIYVLAVTGRKTRFLAMADRFGNVHLVAIGDPVGETPKADPFAFEPSAAYRAALCGDAPAFHSFRKRVRRPVSMDARPRGPLRHAPIRIPDT